MTPEEFVNQLNNEADLLPRMSDIYKSLFAIDEADLTIDLIIIFVQAAFWTGVEAGASSDYQEFREFLKNMSPNLS